MVVVTSSYLTLELCFGWAMTRILGSLDWKADGISAGDLSGMTEAGHWLTSIAVALILLGHFLALWAKEEGVLFPGKYIRKLLGKPSAGPIVWGPVRILAAAALVCAAGVTAYHVEERWLESEAKKASPWDLRAAHATQTISALSKDMEAEVKRMRSDIAFDPGAPCLFRRAPGPTSLRLTLSEEISRAPGGAVLAASLPYLRNVGTVWDEGLVQETNCSADRELNRMLPSANETYRQLYQDTFLPGVAVLYGDPMARSPVSLLSARSTDELQRVRSDPFVQAVASPCFESGALTFRAASCLYKAAKEYAARLGQQAAYTYEYEISQRRAGAVQQYRAKVDEEHAAHMTLPSSLQRLTPAQQSELLALLSQELARRPELVELQLRAEDVVPASLEGISSCEALSIKVRDNISSRAESRYWSMRPPAWTFRSTNSADEYKSRGEAIKLRMAKGPDEIATRCRDKILMRVAHEAEIARGKADAIPTAPREAILAMIALSVAEEGGRDPAVLNWQTQAALRDRINKRLAEAAPGLGLVVAEEDGLPACDATDEWISEALYDWRYEAQQATRTALAQGDLCADLRELVAAGGAAALETSRAGLPQVRDDLRTRTFMLIREQGVISDVEAQSLAYALVPSEWQPVGAAEFGREVETLLIEQMIKPRLGARLASTLKATGEEAVALLEADPANLGQFLQQPPVSRLSRHSLELVVNAVAAYAGVEDTPRQHIAITEPLGIDFKRAWASEVHNPLLKAAKKSAIGDHFIGEVQDYRRGGRCFGSGVEAWLGLILPVTGLALSLGAAAYHLRKLVLYALRVVSLPTIVRHVLAGGVLAALVGAPLFHQPEVLHNPLAAASVARIRDPLQQNGFRYLVAAQASYEPVFMRIHHLVVGERRFDFARFAPAAQREAPAAKMKAIDEDSRIQAARREIPAADLKALSENPVLLSARKSFSDRYFCSPRREG